MHGPHDEGDSVDGIGEINVIPFIDICLVLLIIVLMTSAAQVELAKVDLPDTDTYEYRDMNLAVALTVDKDGRFYFEDGTEPVEAKNLWTFLRSVQGGEPWEMLVIRADRETPYEYLNLGIQCAQALGCADINLAVDKPKDTADGG